MSGPLSGRGYAPPYDQPRQPILPAIIVAAQPAIVVVATQAGIFQTCFVGYYSVNDQVFAELAIDTGQPVPADLWVGLIKDRLCQLPESLDALLAAYRSNREPLGLLASPHEKAAWDFLVKWRDSPDPDLRVPYRLPNGRLVADF